MVSQAHATAGQYLPGAAHQALNSQLPENLRMDEEVSMSESKKPVAAHYEFGALDASTAMTNGVRAPDFMSGL